jgi:DNA-binding transcriptional regulator YiaG
MEKKTRTRKTVKAVKVASKKPSPVSAYDKTWKPFAATMRNRRLEMRLGLGKCAEMIGTTYNTLYCWEHGKHSPSTADAFDRWCAVLGITGISINDVKPQTNG